MTLNAPRRIDIEYLRRLLIKEAAKLSEAYKQQCEPDPILMAAANLASLNSEQYKRRMKLHDEFIAGMREALMESFGND